jgi:hypothetical protein
VVDVVLPLPPLKNAVAVDVDRKTGKCPHTDEHHAAIAGGYIKMIWYRRDILD